MDDGPSSHSTMPSESVSFDDYIPETEQAPYDLKDAFPGADSVRIYYISRIALALCNEIIIASLIFFNIS